MRRMILTILLSFVVGIVLLAQQQTGVDTSGLSADQIKALNAAAEQLKKQPANTIANLTLQNATPDKFKEWADAGAAAGKAVSSFTKEIGIAADQFLKTDVGRIGLYVIIWKLGGDKVVASVFNTTLNVLMAVALFTIWWKLTRRFAFNERHKTTVSYNQNTLLRWIGFNKRDTTWEKDDAWMNAFSDDGKAAAVVVSRVVSAVLLVIIIFACWPSVSF